MKHFDENVDWYIQGDTNAVPWVGRTEVAEHFAQLEKPTPAEKLGATFEGRLVVADAAALRTTLIGGLGPAKAYGCGCGCGC